MKFQRSRPLQCYLNFSFTDPEYANANTQATTQEHIETLTDYSTNLTSSLSEIYQDQEVPSFEFKRSPYTPETGLQSNLIKLKKLETCI